MQDPMIDPLVSVFHEHLPDGADPQIHWIRYEPSRADEAGGVPAANLTILMIPGAGHSAAGFDLLARRLARMGLRCVAINPRGKGVGEDVSSWSRSIHTATMLDAVADVISVMDRLSATQHLHPERYVVLGHSYGGAIARYVAQQRRVAGLILLQAFTPREVREVILSFVGGMLAHVHPYLAILPPLNFTALFSTRRRRRITLLGPTATWADDARCAAQLCAESRSALTGALSLSRARSGPRALTEPLCDRALVIGSEADRMVPARLAEAIANELQWHGVSRAQPAVVPGAPHSGFLMDAYVDAHVELIAPFCASLAVSHLAPVGEARMLPLADDEMGVLDVMSLRREPLWQMDALQPEGAKTQESTDVRP
jgi:pimeloyl-ACP methyl ester carboxylesterase